MPMADGGQSCPGNDGEAGDRYWTHVQQKNDDELEFFTDLAIQETQRWIECVTKKAFKYPEEPLRSLADGILLCELLNCLKPGTVKRVNRLATAMAKLDNISLFLEACQSSFGLRVEQLFLVSDLHATSDSDDDDGAVPDHLGIVKLEEGRRLRSVAITVFWLARQIHSSYQGPEIDFSAFAALVTAKPESAAASGQDLSSDGDASLTDFGVDVAMNSARSDGSGGEHERTRSSDSWDAADGLSASGRSQRSSVSALAANPLQFVALKPAVGLARAAEAVVKRAEQAKVTAQESEGSSKVEDDWQGNLSSWKQRRQSKSYSNLPPSSEEVAVENNWRSKRNSARSVLSKYPFNDDAYGSGNAEDVADDIVIPHHAANVMDTPYAYSKSDSGFSSGSPKASDDANDDADSESEPVASYHPPQHTLFSHTNGEDEPASTAHPWASINSQSGFHKAMLPVDEDTGKDTPEELHHRVGSDASEESCHSRRDEGSAVSDQSPPMPVPGEVVGERQDGRTFTSVTQLKLNVGRNGTSDAFPAPSAASFKVKARDSHTGEEDRRRMQDWAQQQEELAQAQYDRDQQGLREQFEKDRRAAAEAEERQQRKESSVGSQVGSKPAAALTKLDLTNLHDKEARERAARKLQELRQKYAPSAAASASSASNGQQGRTSQSSLEAPSLSVTGVISAGNKAVHDAMDERERELCHRKEELRRMEEQLQLEQGKIALEQEHLRQLRAREASAAEGSAGGLQANAMRKLAGKQSAPSLAEAYRCFDIAQPPKDLGHRDPDIPRVTRKEVLDLNKKPLSSGSVRAPHASSTTPRAVVAEPPAPVQSDALDGRYRQSSEAIPEQGARQRVAAVDYDPTMPTVMSKDDVLKMTRERARYASPPAGGGYSDDDAVARLPLRKSVSGLDVRVGQVNSTVPELTKFAATVDASGERVSKSIDFRSNRAMFEQQSKESEASWRQLQEEENQRRLVSRRKSVGVATVPKPPQPQVNAKAFKQNRQKFEAQPEELVVRAVALGDLASSVISQAQVDRLKELEQIRGEREREAAVAAVDEGAAREKERRLREERRRELAAIHQLNREYEREKEAGSSSLDVADRREVEDGDEDSEASDTSDCGVLRRPHAAVTRVGGMKSGFRTDARIYGDHPRIPLVASADTRSRREASPVQLSNYEKEQVPIMQSEQEMMRIQLERQKELEAIRRTREASSGYEEAAEELRRQHQQRALHQQRLERLKEASSSQQQGYGSAGDASLREIVKPQMPLDHEELQGEQARPRRQAPLHQQYASQKPFVGSVDRLADFHSSTAPDERWWPAGRSSEPRQWEQPRYSDAAARADEMRMKEASSKAADLEQQRRLEQSRRAAELEQQRGLEESRRAADLEQQRRRQEELRQAADMEQQRRLEESRRAADMEQQRRLEESRRAAELEQRRRQEESRRVADMEQQRRLEEARRAADMEQQRRLDDARRAADLEQHRRQEESRRAADMEQQQKLDDARRAAAELEQSRRAAELEQQRKLEESRRAAELEQQRRLEESRRLVELEQQRKMEESQRAAELEQQRRLEELRRMAELEQKRRLEDARRVEELEQELKVEESQRMAELDQQQKLEESLRPIHVQSLPRSVASLEQQWKHQSAYQDAPEQRQQSFERSGRPNSYALAGNYSNAPPPEREYAHINTQRSLLPPSATRGPWPEIEDDDGYFGNRGYGDVPEFMRNSQLYSDVLPGQQYIGNDDGLSGGQNFAHDNYAAFRQPHRQLQSPPQNSQPVKTAAQLQGQSLGSSRQHEEDIVSVSARQHCAYCNKELGKGAAMVIETLSLFFHVDCFRCCVCHSLLSNGTTGADVRVRGKKLHCRNCYSNDEAGVKYSAV